MRKLALMTCVTLALAEPALADPVTGTWRTKPGDDGNFAHVQISPCGSSICGVLAKAFNAQGKPIQSANVGKRMVWDMKPRGGGAYSGGKIWAPDRDKVYNSKMQLNGDRLTVKGCVAGGLICRGQDWTRVK